MRRRQRLFPLEVQKGVVKGVASLSLDGRIPPDQMPSNITVEQLTVTGGNGAASRIDGNLEVVGSLLRSGVALSNESAIGTDATLPRFRIHDASNVTALAIRQDGSGSILDVRDAQASIVRVVDGGNVGIGWTNPASRLHVSGHARVEGMVELTGEVLTFFLQTADGRRWKYVTNSAAVRLNTGVDMELILKSTDHPLVNDPTFNANVYSMLIDSGRDYPTFHESNIIVAKPAYPTYSNIGVVFEPQVGGGVRIRSSFQDRYYGYDPGTDTVRQFLPGDGRIQTWFQIPSKTIRQVHAREILSTGTTNVGINLISNGAVDATNLITAQLFIVNNTGASALVVRQQGLGPVMDVRRQNESAISITDGVGIGVSTPISKLHVAGDVQVTGTLRSERGVYQAISNVIYGTSPAVFQAQVVTPLSHLVYNPVTHTFTVTKEGCFTFIFDDWFISPTTSVPTWYVSVASVGDGTSRPSTTTRDGGSVSVWGYVGDRFQILISWTETTQVFADATGGNLIVQYT